MKRWYWRCQWDDCVGKDRDCCRARSKCGFVKQEDAFKAAARHLKKANHKSVYADRWNKTPTIHIWEE